MKSNKKGSGTSSLQRYYKTKGGKEQQKLRDEESDKKQIKNLTTS